jgi:signal transduction histidine kinase
MQDKRVIKVLLVDDDKEDYLITRDIIGDIHGRKYKLDWVSNYTEGIEAINKVEHDAYLIDYRLGSHTGLSIIEEAIRNGCTAPLILLTGQDDITIDEEAMKAGAADYLVKSTINPHLLDRSLRYSISHARTLRQLSELNSELERRVERRTGEIVMANKKLEESKEEIRRAYEKEKELGELKSRFVSMASHEFRTPLSTILSSISLIEEYSSPTYADKRTKHIERIKGNVKNLTEILNDLLSLGRLEEGKIEAVPSQFDVKEFSEEVTEDMQAVAKEKQQINYSHSGKATVVFLDKKLLRNVMFNLLNNAIKYSFENGEIDFSTSLKDTKLTITVADHGIGIPESDKPHLFDRFFRARNATNIQGTGLGLNIVKRYIDLLGGTIDFTSEVNKGTTFTVTLPAKKE